MQASLKHECEKACATGHYYRVRIAICTCFARSKTSPVNVRLPLSCTRYDEDMPYIYIHSTLVHIISSHWSHPYYSPHSITYIIAYFTLLYICIYTAITPISPNIHISHSPPYSPSTFHTSHHIHLTTHINTTHAHIHIHIHTHRMSALERSITSTLLTLIDPSIRAIGLSRRATFRNVNILCHSIIKYKAL